MTSLHRFQATTPKEPWQSDSTHYRPAAGDEVEIITWLDDCTRYALHVSARQAITTLLVAPPSARPPAANISPPPR